jgi:probable HAF family extracellular repeat protein
MDINFRKINLTFSLLIGLGIMHMASNIASAQSRIRDVHAKDAFNVNNNSIPDEFEATYVIRESSALGGMDLRVNGVNDRGIGVGSSTTGVSSDCYVGPQVPYGNSPLVRAVRIHDKSIQDLGTLDDDKNAYSRAYAVNFRGITVGESGFACLGPYHRRAVAWVANRIIDLGTIGGLNSVANDINDHFEITGSAVNSSGKWRAFIWKNGEMQELPATASTSYAFAINNHGDVVGVNGSLYYGTAVLWKDNVMYTLSNWGNAHAINDLGHAVGEALNPATSKFEAVVWASDGTVSFLGTLNGGTSSAYGINNGGLVVGQSRDSYNSVPAAFVYDQDTLMDLNGLISPNSGWQLVRATSINDVGDITGYGYKHGQVKGFKLIRVRQ